MKRNISWAMCALLVLSAVFTAAYAAKITSISFCEQVSEDGTIPINVTSRFGGDAPSVHAVINIEKAKKGSTVRGVWVSVDAIETPDYEIDAAEAVAPSADAVVHFALSRPDNGWPFGHYKLDVYIDGKFVVSAPFSVIGEAEDKSAPPKALTEAKESRQSKEPIEPNESRAPRESKGSKDRTGKGPVKKDARSALLGTWQCRMPTGTSTLVFESANRLILDGQPANYSVVSNALRVKDESGTQDYPYTLEDNVLTIGFPEGYQLQFTRVSDKSEYTGEDYPPGAETEYGVYDEGQTVDGIPGGGETTGQPPSGEQTYGGPSAGGDADLMNHFSGTWWNATTNTETNVTLTADGRYFESSTSGYSGSSSDQYGNTDMSWGTAGDQSAQGTWTVRGTREQGVLTILFQNGNQRKINYQVHVENGEVYWSEYYFNGELYGKKTE